MRDGVTPSRVFLPKGPWPTLLHFLRQRFPYVPPAILLQRLDSGQIVDQAGRPQSRTSPYRPMGWLWYYRDVPDEIPVPFALDVLYRDAHLVVVDKPHFLASIPGGRYLKETALVRLRKLLSLPELSPIHRLDRDTAGVMLFCADAASRGAYQTLFQSHRVHKEYEAVAALRPGLLLPTVYRSRLEDRPDSFAVREMPGPPNTETHVALLGEAAHGLGLYRLRPKTGHKHQLRAHMGALGIPICNDALYPDCKGHPDRGDFSRPLQLLARSIRFVDPFSGRDRNFASRRRLQLAR
jgi:tRNA pseudouridine32 synthase/23S rRNA pseudouridine746 synthase